MKNLREQRAKLSADVAEILGAAKTANRALSGEETEKVNRMFADMDAIKATISAEERNASIAAELDKPVRVTEPSKPGQSETLSLRQIALDPAWAGKEFAVYKSEQERAIAKSNVAGLLDVDVAGAFEKSLKYFGPMWEVAHVFHTETGNSLQYPTVDDTSNVAEQKAEGAAVTTNVDPTFGSVVFGAYKYSSKAVLVGVETLNDSMIPLEPLIGELLAERIARASNTDFTTKTNGPIGVVASATAGSTGATNAITYANIVDLVHSVDPWRREGASFMAHDNVIAYLRKLTDSNGLPLWQPSVQAGVPDKLLGCSIYTNNDMASAVSTGNKTILFGNFKKYKIRRVGSLSMIVARELYAANHQVGFFGFLRADGALIDAGTDPVKYFAQA